MRSRSLLIVMALVCSSTFISYADEATAPASTGNGKSSAINQFDLSHAAPSGRQATTAGPRLPLLTRQPTRRSVGSALSPHVGIGKGVSVDRTYDDAQYTRGQGRYISHWFNDDYSAGAEVSIHFGYRDLADTTPGSANQMSAYNVYDAITGTYTSAEWEMDNCVQGYEYHGAKAMSQSLLQDTSHYRDGSPLTPAQPNPVVWWDELATPGLISDAAESDQAIWMTYGHDINLAANDTLYFITVLSTVRDGSLADLEGQVNYARQWYYSTVVGCGCACCCGRVGDANGSGGGEPTIGDISVMIDAKFITGNCVGSGLESPIIPCIPSADINQSGGPSPTCADITIGDISYLIDYLFITGPELGLPDCL